MLRVNAIAAVRPIRHKYGGKLKIGLTASALSIRLTSVRRRRLRWVNKTAPLIHMIHSYATFEPEEDTLIYEQLGLRFLIVTCAWVPSFAGWY